MNDVSRQVLVTGVSRGLGRALVDGLVEAGHTVIGCARSATAIEELSTRFGPPHVWRVLDVTDDEQVSGWAAEILAVQGPPDLLVNNAAVINANAPLWEVSAAEFAQVTNVNLNGVATMIRHFVPAMIARGSGTIANMSSGWGRTTAPEVAPYCATKWGIEGLTQAFAAELPAGMAAVAVNPGVIDTEMLQSCFGAAASSYPDPVAWAKVAVPFLLGLGPSDNGSSVSVPL